MLLKFTGADMLNTSLVDVSTGANAYEITTSLVASDPDSASETESITTGQPKTRRQTIITDGTGAMVASMMWNGRHPDITIVDEKVGGLTELFGSNTTRFMPKMLLIPTRFDTEYTWMATADSLTLYDYDSESIKGTFHHNVIRLPTFKSKGTLSRKSSISSETSSCSSTETLATTANDSSDSLAKPQPVYQTGTETSKSAFIPTHLPGVGSNYIEFSSHPLANDVEMVISFLMMEILRRGRFLLTPYTFEKPKLWQLKEARDLVLRRLRRNTI